MSDDNKNNKETKSKDDKKSDNMFTPGNIILGIIIIVLVASLFFDFFGGSSANEVPKGCPQPIEGLMISNVAYVNGDEVFTQDRILKPAPDQEGDYAIRGLLRNLGEEEIIIKQVLLTTANLGEGEIIELEEPIIVKAGSVSQFDIKLDRGDYHKIDLYADACRGEIIFHEFGNGSKYEWELEETEDLIDNGTISVNETTEIMEEYNQTTM